MRDELVCLLSGSIGPKVSITVKYRYEGRLFWYSTMVTQGMDATIGAAVKQLERKARLLVVDDHPVIRRAICCALQSHPYVEVCGEASDGGQAIEEAKKLKPDVVVIDVTMPVLNGFEAAREIKKILPESAIIIFSQNFGPRFVDEAKKVGARAYVAKKKAEVLVSAVEAVIRNEDFFVAE